MGVTDPLKVQTHNEPPIVYNFDGLQIYTDDENVLTSPFFISGYTPILHVWNMCITGALYIHV